MSGVHVSTAAPPPRDSRSVLVVVYYFPPSGGGPVLRTLKLVKYLHPLNWRVAVLTAQPEYYEAVSHDPGLLDDLSPATRVLRTRSLQPTGSLARGVLAEAVGGHADRAWLTRLIMPFARFIHQCLIPDDKVFWLPHGLVGGVRLLREVNPSVIYVSVPPHSSALLALALSRIARKPLVVDFRDDWVGNPLFRRSWRLRSRIEHLMERAVVHASAAIIVPTISSKGVLIGKYPELRDRIHVVPNGYDEEDIRHARLQLPAEPGAAREKRLRCVYTGLVTKRRDLSPFFHALKRLNDRDPGSVQMRFAGFLPWEAREVLSRLRLQDQVHELGYLPHIEALREILAADVAVLVSTAAEGARTAVPSKLFEYVACGAFVLGLVDDGATRELIEQNEWGLVCSPDAPAAIERALHEMVQRKNAGSLALLEKALNQVAAYSRRAQARVVADVLHRAIEGTPAVGST